MIRFESVSKVFPGGVQAVSDLSFEVRPGETLVLLGTSGSGKTTTMKMINRLIEPTCGTIYIQGENIADQDPINLRRHIGYAIQHVGLFTHMTIAENIAVVPKLLKYPSIEIDGRVNELLKLVGLDPLEFRDRYPYQLSGGQKQRVGVVRALASDPPVVLMDEPFGALDPITREQLQDEFIELESEIAKTVIFVTHDIFEAVKMGDRVALLHEGQLQQLTSPADLVENPANETVEQFLGQHRFQLSLLTRTLQTLSAEFEADDQFIAFVSGDRALRSGFSLIRAWEQFKQIKTDRLPVYQKRNYIGHLYKSTLLATITKILQTS